MLVFTADDVMKMETRGPTGPYIAHPVHFATIHQSPPMDGSWSKFANIYAKSRSSKNKSSDI